MPGTTYSPTTTPPPTSEQRRPGAYPYYLQAGNTGTGFPPSPTAEAAYREGRNHRPGRRQIEGTTNSPFRLSQL